MKKGIVLMMTLGFITIITALILWSLNITKSRFDKLSYINLQNQFSIIFDDFSKLVKKFDINSSDRLDMFLSMSFPTITESKSGIGVGFEVETLMDKLNINYMLKTIVDSETNSSKESEARYYRRALERYFYKIKLSDPYAMINFLLDSIDLDDIERSNDSEVINRDLNFRQGKLFDFKQIEKIKNYYYESTQDINILNFTKESFEEIFYFGDIKKYGLLDCSSLDIDNVMQLIIEDEMVIGEGIDYCQESKNQSMKKLKKIYNISKYTNKSKYFVKCILNLDTEDSRNVISFDYEVNSKRISNIDKVIE